MRLVPCAGCAAPVQLARSRLFLSPTYLTATKIKHGEELNLLQRSTRKKLNGRNFGKALFLWFFLFLLRKKERTFNI